MDSSVRRTSELTWADLIEANRLWKLSRHSDKIHAIAFLGYQRVGLLIQREVTGVSFLLFLIVSLCGCGPRGTHVSTAATADSTSSPPSKADSSSSILSEIIIAPEQFDKTTTLKVGQAFWIRPPLDLERWNVSFDPKILAFLLPQGKMQLPGKEGWRFRVVAPGQTEITLSSAPAAGSFAPVAARISLTVKAVD